MQANKGIVRMVVAAALAFALLATAGGLTAQPPEVTAGCA